MAEAKASAATAGEVTTIEAVYENGVFKPSKDPGLPEGEVVRLSFSAVADSADDELDPTLATAGAWKGLVDCEKFKRLNAEQRARTIADG